MFCIFTLIFDQKLADDSFYNHVINKISESQFTTNKHSFLLCRTRIQFRFQALVT
jgi:hypothetical protein